MSVSVSVCGMLACDQLGLHRLCRQIMNYMNVQNASNKQWNGKKVKNKKNIDQN